MNVDNYIENYIFKKYFDSNYRLYKVYNIKLLPNVYKAIILSNISDNDYIIFSTQNVVLKCRTTFPTKLYESMFKESDNNIITTNIDNFYDYTYYYKLHNLFSKLINEKYKCIISKVYSIEDKLVFTYSSMDINLRNEYNDFISGGLKYTIPIEDNKIESLFDNYYLDEINIIGDNIQVNELKALKEGKKLNKYILDKVIDINDAYSYIKLGYYPLIGSNIIYGKNKPDKLNRLDIDGVEVFTQEEYRNLSINSLIKIDSNYYSIPHLMKYNGNKDPITGRIIDKEKIEKERKKYKICRKDKEDRNLNIIFKDNKYYCYIEDKLFWIVPTIDGYTEILYLLRLRWKDILNTCNIKDDIILNFVPKAVFAFNFDLSSESDMLSAADILFSI